MKNHITVGIDASNIIGAGGRTHLVELLRVVSPSNSNIKKIFVWAPFDTLDLIENNKFIIKKSSFLINRGFLLRTFWQTFILKYELMKANCDILFSPGGLYLGTFTKVVSMSQNMLPFEWNELKRYGFSFTFIRLLLLHVLFIYTFNKSIGTIFLTKYAYHNIKKSFFFKPNRNTFIPHGINKRFINTPRAQLPIHEFNINKPLTVIYVSIIDTYKHHCSVIKAISLLRSTGLPIELLLVGPAYFPSLKLLNSCINELDPKGRWVYYLGSVPFHKLHFLYTKADIGLFASSCENLPNILIENMAAGLPIACSHCGPMPEILEDTGLYFNPENPNDIAECLLQLINSPKLRSQLASKSFNLSKQYTWERCANETFKFLYDSFVQFQKTKN